MRGKRHHVYHGYDIDGHWHPAPKVDDDYIYRPRPLLPLEETHTFIFTPTHTAARSGYFSRMTERMATFFLGPQSKLLPLPSRIHVSGGVISHYANIDKVLYDTYPYHFLGIGAILEASEQGLLVRELVSDSPAEQSGLQLGDIINRLKIKDHWLSLVNVSANKVRDYFLNTPEKEITLSFIRGSYQSPEVSLVRHSILCNPHDIGPLTTRTTPRYVVDRK